MFLRRYCCRQFLIYKKQIISDDFAHISAHRRSLSGLPININNVQNDLLNRILVIPQHSTSLLRIIVINRSYSTSIIDGDVTELLSNQHEQGLNKIRELFPEPRATLNILQQKVSDKVFDVHYKQLTNTPKIAKKKNKPNNDWICTYLFNWPEKHKFESTSLSKRQAADKAATSALHWLYVNNRIDDKGSPIYDKDVIKQMQSNIEEVISISISEKSMERIENVWSEYEKGIREVYSRTFEEAKNRFANTPAALTKDSTIDNDDGFNEEQPAADIEDSDFTDSTQVHPVYGRVILPPSEAFLSRRERHLAEMFENCQQMALPIDEYSKQITSTIASARVTVIVGAAGCGKSTRVPAAILRDFGAKSNVIVTEPRRVAAVGLAERVASELGEKVGESVGYQVRLQSKTPTPPCGSILYCTSGVLLRRLRANPGLIGCSHVIIDEAHERDVNTDITLLLLKRALNLNPELKVVVMSATLHTDIFTKYFNSSPVVEVPGRNYHVEVFHLDAIQDKYNLRLFNALENCRKEDGKPMINCQEVAQLIKAIDKTEEEGAILVFLPGWAEIKQTKQILDAYYGQSNFHIILPVHSRLSTADQVRMFASPPPGCRKIVLSTNIAETSVTIPDVVYVIDTGAHKENRIREGTGTSTLESVWVSQAGAKQRTGRAGRVQPGQCFRMYTKEKESEFTPYTTPEILRIPLDQVVLDLKSYSPDEPVEQFMSELPEPPSNKAVQFAVNDLIDIGALSPNHQLSRLGSLLSRMSLSPRLSLSLLHAAILCDVTAIAPLAVFIGDAVQICDSIEDKSEFRELKAKFNNTSDFAALHWLLDEFNNVLSEKGSKDATEWCKKNGLRRDRIKFVQALSNLYLDQVLRSGIIEPTIEVEELTRFSGIDELTSATLLSGSNSLLIAKKKVRTKGKLRTSVELFTSRGDRAHIGLESVNYSITKRAKTPAILSYFGGRHSTERSALVVYNTSRIPPHTALLFCMGDLRKDLLPDSDGETTVLSLPKHKLHVQIPTSQADTLLKAKEMIWNTLKYYIERDIKTLDYEENVTLSRFKVKLLKTIGRILVEGHRECVLGKGRAGNVKVHFEE